MSTLSMEVFEQSGLDVGILVLTEKLKPLNASFVSYVTAENGFYGKIDGLSQLIKEQTGWSDDIVNAIRSPEEYKIYKDAGLVEGEVGGRKCLLKTDIDWNQTDEFNQTNSARRQNGYNAIAKNGQVIELHHMGQYKDSPLAELTWTEHRGKGNFTIIHDFNRPTEVHGENNEWLSEKKEFLRARSEAMITQKSAFARALGTADETGMKTGLYAAGITAAISTVDNVRSVMSGEISAQEAFIDVAKDTGTAVVIGYGTGFVGSAVANAATQSSHALIRSLGSTGVPAAAIAFGIDAYDSVMSYAQGEISGAALAYDLGESATGVAGSMAGAAIGAAVGSVMPIAGTAVGGLVGGMVGYTVAVGAYATAIEVATGGVDVLVGKTEAVNETVADAYKDVSEVVVEGAQVVSAAASSLAGTAVDSFSVASTAAIESANVLKDKAVEMGQGVIDLVANTAPDAVEDVKSAMNDFASNLGLSLHL